MKSIITATLLAAVSLTIHAAEVGKAAPAFTAKDLKGESVSLADFKGKVVVLEWVNFDCPFVEKHYSSGNMPKLQTDSTAKGVVWITLNSAAKGKQGYHEPSAMAEVAAGKGNKAARFIMDSDGTIGKAYDAKVTPHMFVIDGQGTLVYNGAMDSKATTDTADVATADKYFANAARSGDRRQGSRQC